MSYAVPFTENIFQSPITIDPVAVLPSSEMVRFCEVKSKFSFWYEKFGTLLLLSNFVPSLAVSVTLKVCPTSTAAGRSLFAVHFERFLLTCTFVVGAAPSYAFAMISTHEVLSPIYCLSVAFFLSSDNLNVLNVSLPYLMDSNVGLSSSLKTNPFLAVNIKS